ncbi:MAG: transporter permease, partial [candidate division NC10 bacterium]|nr:transporter permease [candidate division NC10 bacterium]
MSTLRKILKTRTNILMGGAIVGLMSLTAVFAAWLAPYDPVDDANLMYALEAPSRQFLFGTDS